MFQNIEEQEHGLFHVPVQNVHLVIYNMEDSHYEITWLKNDVKFTEYTGTVLCAKYYTKDDVVFSVGGSKFKNKQYFDLRTSKLNQNHGVQIILNYD